MTDRSPVGWTIPQDYEVDPIASDSDDGKKS